MSDEMTKSELTRAYLSQLKTIDNRIRFKLEEADRWRGIAENHSSNLSDCKVQTTPKPDKMADAITNAMMYEKESYELANRLISVKHTLISQIDSMDEKHYTFLNLFFIQNKRYKDISSVLDCSFGNVKNGLRESIKAFGEKYDEDIRQYGENLTKR